MEATLKKVRTVNGVNVKRLYDTIQAVKANPSLKDFRFRAVNEWIDCGHNRSTIKDFYGAGQEDTTRDKPFVLDNDEPDVLLGANNGANPVEYVLHALAGCITTSLVYHAAARGIHVESITSTYEGYIDLRGFLGIDPDVPRGYQNIQVTFDIKGDLTQEQKQQLIELGQNYSPVFGTITNPVKVAVKLA
ncbi:MAG: OsmC family protein [Saprospiraceae bacterium]|nr:OsmC family protein [Saprospiraceae bacterium]